MEYRIGELFAGAGGLAMGAKLAKLDTPNGPVFPCKSVWANDINYWACETYKRNIGGLVINGPIQGVDIQALEPIDGLMFGFPCNDYSLVGEHKGLAGDYGPLYTYGVKALDAHNPMWFLAENVSGLQSANEGGAFQKILQELEVAGRYGYVLTPHLYKFEQYGVPQMRHRIIVVGIRRDLKMKFEVPAPTTVHKPKSVREALRGVEKVTANNEHTRHAPRTVKMLEYIQPGENAWNANIPEELQLNVAGCRLSHIYRRLHPDLPAPTVTARGGGGTHGYHWEENRALTNRERARIQTFPDTFIFEGPKEEVRAQIGMAVPPEGARLIVEAILKTLAGENYDHIEARWAMTSGQIPLFLDGAAD